MSLLYDLRCSFNSDFLHYCFCLCVCVCLFPGAADGGEVSAEEPAGSEGRSRMELVETFLQAASSARCEHGQRKAESQGGADIHIGLLQFTFF